jgi:hypothetical protein
VNGLGATLDAALGCARDCLIEHSRHCAIVGVALEVVALAQVALEAARKILTASQNRGIFTHFRQKDLPKSVLMIGSWLPDGTARSEHQGGLKFFKQSEETLVFHWRFGSKN